MTILTEQTERVVTDDLQALIQALPPSIAQALNRLTDAGDLLEIVMDLGRVPSARFRSGEQRLTDLLAEQSDIDYVITRIGDFGDDNRAGIERTVHRISAIRNRRGRVMGLTS